MLYQQMKSYACIILIFLLMTSCAVPAYRIINDIPPPAGYMRIVYEKKSFSRWLGQLSIKLGTDIISYNGSRIKNHSFHIFAVVAKPLLFADDIEQCADFCMRLWAEYHKETGKPESLYLFDYKGQRKYYTQSAMDFSTFLRRAMSFTNPHSLQLGSQPLENKPEPGNFFIQADNTSKGHTSLILDACKNSKGELLYLIGFAYMPAQEFHIEKAPPEYGKAGWFSLEGYKQYLTDFYNEFGPVHARRF